MKRLIRSASLLLAMAGTPLIAQAPAAPAAAPALSISGPVIRVTDMERAIKFYTEGLGLTVSQRYNATTVVLAGAGKAPPPLILLILGTGGDAVKPVQLGDGLSRIMLNTPDSAAVHARLKAAGYAPEARGASGVFFVKDPDGYRYEITQSAPPRPRAGS